MRFISTLPWWVATGVSLKLELLPSGDAFSAWQSALLFATGPPPACPGGNCSVLRAALVGPFDLDSTRLVQLVTRQASMLQLSYAATDDSLTQNDYVPIDPSTWQPFLRATHTDTMAIGAVYSFILSSGWKMVTIIYSKSDSHAVAQASMLSNMLQQNGALSRLAGGDEAACYTTNYARPDPHPHPHPSPPLRLTQPPPRAWPSPR